MARIHSLVRDGLGVRLSDGRTLGFAEYGDPRGKPLLYFHGGISCRLDMAWAAEQLADRGIRLIAPDRPGLGLSDRKIGRNLLDWSFDVDELLNELELNKVALLGWSLGSAYVFPCAYNMPHRLTKVATIGSCAPFDVPDYIAEMGLFVDRCIITCPEQFRWLLRTMLVVAGKAPAHMLKKQAESEVSKSAADFSIVRSMSIRDVTDFVYGSLQQGGDGIIDDYWAAREPWDFDAGEIGIEISLLQGDEDTIAPLSGATRLSTMIPGARLIMVPRSGHFLIHNNFDLVMDTLFK